MFTPEAEFVLGCSRTRLNAAALARLKALSEQGINWEAVVSIATAQGTAALVYHAIQKTDSLNSLAPAEVIAKLKNYYYSHLGRNLRLWKEFSAIQDCLRVNNIEVIPLKGIILGNLLYRNPALRPIFADIDILVRPEDAMPASRLLEELGYGAAGPCADYQKMFRKGPVLLDLHWNFLLSWLDRIDMPLVWQRARQTAVSGRQVKTLSSEDTLLTLSLQVRYDLPRIRLIRFCDINELLCADNSHLDWDYVIRAARDWQISGPLLFCLAICKKLFGTNVNGGILKTLSRHSWKKKALLFISQKAPLQILNKSLSFREGNLRKRLIKFLLIDNPADCLNIIRHQIRCSLRRRLPSCKTR
jgi:hypothetical protein